MTPTEAAESDGLEQARLNGIGAEREAALLAKLEAAEKEREALRAKIEHMETQEPVAWTTELALRHGASTLGFDACRGNLWGDKGVPLYALPGAQPAPENCPCCGEPMRVYSRCSNRDCEAVTVTPEQARYNKALAFARTVVTRMEDQTAPSVPIDSIGKLLTQAMDVAVANGANSVSMPDELVEVAAWLSGVQPAPKPEGE